jgi:hypothetical protein
LRCSVVAFTTPLACLRRSARCCAPRSTSPSWCHLASERKANGRVLRVALTPQSCSSFPTENGAAGRRTSIQAHPGVQHPICSSVAPLTRRSPQHSIITQSSFTAQHSFLFSFLCKTFACGYLALIAGQRPSVLSPTCRAPDRCVLCFTSFNGAREASLVLREASLVLREASLVLIEFLFFCQQSIFRC